MVSFDANECGVYAVDSSGDLKFYNTNYPEIKE